MTTKKNPNPVRYSVWHAPSGNVYRVVDLIPPDRTTAAVA